MFYQSMPLYLELINLLKLEYRLNKNIAKQYRYSLGEKILDLTWQMLDSFIEVQHLSNISNSNKTALIKTMITYHEKLQLRLKFLGELQLISLKQQAQLLIHTTAIGKMLGSWLKHVQK